MRIGFLQLLGHMCYGFLNAEDVRVAGNIREEDALVPAWVVMIADADPDGDLEQVRLKARRALGEELLAD